MNRWERLRDYFRRKPPPEEGTYDVFVWPGPAQDKLLEIIREILSHHAGYPINPIRLEAVRTHAQALLCRARDVGLLERFRVQVTFKDGRPPEMRWASVSATTIARITVSCDRPGTLSIVFPFSIDWRTPCS